MEENTEGTGFRRVLRDVFWSDRGIDTGKKEERVTSLCSNKPMNSKVIGWSQGFFFFFLLTRFD